MSENKLADLSMDFAVEILKICDSIKRHYSMNNVFFILFSIYLNPVLALSIPVLYRKSTSAPAKSAKLPTAALGI